MRLLASFLLVASVSSLVFAQDAGRDAGPGDAAAPDSGAERAPLASFVDGTFELTDAQATDRDVNEAVDAAIRSLHPSMRDAFRSQLRATLRMPRRLVIAREANRGRITWDAAALDASLDGSEAAARGPEGRSIRLAMRVEQGGMAVVQRTGGFVRTDRIGGGPHGLVVHVSLRSGLLRAPIELTATYASRVP